MTKIKVSINFLKKFISYISLKMFTLNNKNMYRVLNNLKRNYIKLIEELLEKLRFIISQYSMQDKFTKD